MGRGSYGEPDWANPDNTTVTAPTQDAGVTGASVKQNTPSIRGSSGRGRDSCILASLSLADMGISVMMAALGVLVCIHYAGNLTSTSEVFLAAYMILFATLLFLYELMWWKAIPFVNKTIRKNFGFLYGLKGKGFYLIFVAFLCLGLGDDVNVNKALPWATGLSFLGMGILHFFVVFMFPDTAIKYQAPTAGLDRFGEETNSPV